jgi:hypothetical protein
VSKLTLLRTQMKNIVLEPDRSAASPNQWRLVSPVTAQADARAVTQLLAALSELRAESFAADSIGDGRVFGLDQPAVELSWLLEAPPAAGAEPAAKSRPAAAASGGGLKIGKPVPRKPGAFFAALAGQPYVFTLGSAAVQPFLAEFHDCQIFSFAADAVRRVVFNLPGRKLAFARKSQPRGEPSDWRPEPLTDARGVDLSRFTDLVKQLAQLRTPRFVQYDGAISSSLGLDQPRLTIEVETADGKPPRSLRIGESQGPLVFAASGNSNTGAVFYLPAAAWNALVQSLSSGEEIPANPFAPG